MQPFCVITADIIKSRKYLNAKEEINNKLDQLNKKLKNELFTSFVLSRGDEIQAVLNNIEFLPEVIRNVRYYCRPFQLRLGVGIGYIEAILDNQNHNSWDMNGQAFYLARDAMDTLNKLQRKHSTPYKKHYPATYLWSMNEALNLSLNSIYILVDSIIRNWNDEQWETIMLYESLGTYELVSRQLSISKSAVQQRCDLANWRSIVAVEKNLKGLLQRCND
ncbi:SatD family protein [Crassaminicella profunda]|uniref:SatD family protein n=1 Tax=Crassaminicella profunda TaxID=1286698 RepID=UPI001CA778ED|nr:SatD family protein [Crassaminicella profunda]QZY55757.1 SatD family protein [Crassaminicella profunda]